MRNDGLVLCVAWCILGRQVLAYPDRLGCSRVIEVGGATIMSATPVADTTYEWIFERSGVQVACGGEYVAGESLNVRLDASGVRYVMELSAGTFSGSGCDGTSDCGGTRCAKGTGSTTPSGTGQALTAPTDGSDLVVHGAWASGFGAVKIPNDCLLTAAAAVTSAPSAAPDLSALPTLAPSSALESTTMGPTLSPTVSSSQVTKVGGNVTVNRGILVDLYCMQRPQYPTAFDGANLLTSPQDHSVHCMRDVQACRDSGFGVLTQQSDGTYGLAYAFDAQGNEAVLAWLDETAIIDTVEVTVLGLETGNSVFDTWPELSNLVFRFHNEIISHTGYLVDLYCMQRDEYPIAIDGANLLLSPQDHSIHCMRDVEVCRDNGFGLLRLTDDGCGYELAYSFDAIGSQLALAYIDNSTKIDNVILTVTGERDTAGTIYVETLLEEAFEIHEGFLVDLYCMQRPEYPIAFDGANLLTSPRDHSVHCMRDVQVCRDSGFGLLKMADDGTYELAFVFDAAGNDAVLAFLDSTSIIDNVLIRAQGIPLASANATTILSDLDFSPPESCTTETVAPSPESTGASTTCDLLPSDDPDFEHSVQLDADLKLYWTIETSGTVASASFYPAMRAMLVKQGDGWAALAVSQDAFMPGSEAVLVDNGLLPEKHDLVGYSRPVRADNARQTLEDASTELANGNLVARWTKSLSEAGEIAISAESGVAQQFLYASGPDATVTYHQSRRAPIAIELSPECGAVAEVPTAAPTTLAFFENQNGIVRSCDSEDPDNFDFSLALDSSLTFSWRIDGDAVSAQLLKRGGGFAAIAASLDEFMPGSDAIVGQEDSLPEKYRLVARSRPPRRSDDEQTLEETSVTILPNGDVDYRFKKLLVEDGEVPLLRSGSTRFVWAHGSGGLAFHGRDNVGAFALDLSTCGFQDIDVSSVQPMAIKIHGMLMIAAWAYLAPLGVLFARSKRFFLNLGFFKLWLYAHAFIQLAALVCTAIGFAKAYEAIADADVRDGHLKFRHPKLGVWVMAGACLQLIMGILRPHPPKDGETKSKRRLAFEIAHRLVGYGTLVLALFTMLAGINKAFELDLIDQVYTWNTAVIAPIATAAFLGILLTAYITFLQEEKPVPATQLKETEMA